MGQESLIVQADSGPQPVDNSAETKGDSNKSINKEAKGNTKTVQKVQEQPIKEPKLDNIDNNTPWEAQGGWLYTEHGEWIQEGHNKTGEDHGNPLETEEEWIRSWRDMNDDDFRIHQEVWRRGYPNRWGARIPVNSTWNLEVFQQRLQGYEDAEVIEWLKYGWPTGRLPTIQSPVVNRKNHKGATDYPEHLQAYIQKEARYGAVMGPFKKIPFKDKVGISPLSTRPKKGSKERRVILDLSFPMGQAVNDGIPGDTYMGIPVKLTFPKTDDFACRIYQLGPGCLMFKVDLSRYFRQIPLDPGDYSLIGYVINGDIYFDKVLPMGMR